MIEELKKQIVKNLISSFINKDLKEIESIGNIKKNSMSIIEDYKDSKLQSLVASLSIDCPKLLEEDKILDYCVCIYATFLPGNEKEFEICNFFIQEQIGTSWGIPIHGQPISDNDQILLVLKTFDEELQKFITEKIQNKL